MSSTIRFALDATYAAFPDRAGIGIYSEQLIAALARTIPAEELSRASVTLAFRPGPFLKWAWRQRWPRHFGISPLLDPWLRIPRATLFHGLNQRLTKKPYPVQVITLHERYPSPSAEYSTAAFRRHMGSRIQFALERADRIIAISNAVREHLLLHQPELARKVRVIHHGVSPAQPASAEEAAKFREAFLGLQRQERFFLDVGAVQTRKNVGGIILAMKQLPGSRVVVAGGSGHGAAEINELVRREGMTDRVRFLGHQRGDVLRLLYSSALALVFPSFEEAFGLPILEAMSYGLPVITSNITAMPEVAGDAALLVDPNQIDEIADAMRRVADDPELAARLRDKGKQRAAQFTWEQCARETWAVYQEALQGFR